MPLGLRKCWRAWSFLSNNASSSDTKGQETKDKRLAKHNSPDKLAQFFEVWIEKLIGNAWINKTYPAEATCVCPLPWSHQGHDLEISREVLSCWAELVWTWTILDRTWINDWAHKNIFLAWKVSVTVRSGRQDDHEEFPESKVFQHLYLHEWNEKIVVNTHGQIVIWHVYLS